MYADLGGKVAIVTGSGRAKGLGEAMVMRLAAEGCKVVVSTSGGWLDEANYETTAARSVAMMARFHDALARPAKQAKDAVLAASD